uniref:tRNA (adenosine(37)-N6)-dimethylallyltransferase MiaA n=1 Tax=Sporichthya sp. TaxID=65475 RepID=UPI00183BB213
DIGTAKLSPGERQGVPHHLLDVWDVTQPASVAAYQTLARSAIASIHSRGTVPVLVGGSGLYLRAVLDDLRFPGTDPAVRGRLEDELDRLGPGILHDRLRARDSPSAARIQPQNGRRIVRALEVIELTGRPFAAALPEPRYLRPAVQIGLGAERETLDRRLDERVDAMWAAGLVEEVRALLPRGLREGRTAGKALGYAQVLQFFDGTCDEETARAETKRTTRKFARRQMTWFGRDARVHWLPADHPHLLDAALAAIATPSPAGSAAGTDRAGSVP